MLSSSPARARRPSSPRPVVTAPPDAALELGAAEQQGRVQGVRTWRRALPSAPPCPSAAAAASAAAARSRCAAASACAAASCRSAYSCGRAARHRRGRAIYSGTLA